MTGTARYWTSQYFVNDTVKIYVNDSEWVFSGDRLYLATDVLRILGGDNRKVRRTLNSWGLKEDKHYVLQYYHHKPIRIDKDAQPSRAIFLTDTGIMQLVRDRRFAIVE